jgi:hypothetical protein
MTQAPVVPAVGAPIIAVVLSLLIAIPNPIWPIKVVNTTDLSAQGERIAWSCRYEISEVCGRAIKWNSACPI